MKDVGRSSYGERGLKFIVLYWHLPKSAGRSSYGERGLKFFSFVCCCCLSYVAPLTGSVD